MFNPATGRRSADVELASSSEINDAVARAVVASKDWRHASLSQRSGVLFAFRALLHERTAELAAIVTAEHGKIPCRSTLHPRRRAHDALIYREECVTPPLRPLRKTVNAAVTGGLASIKGLIVCGDPWLGPGR